MVEINKLLYKTQEGIELNESEEKRLFIYLGFYKKNILIVVASTLVVFCSLAILIMRVKHISRWYYFIPIGLSILFLSLHLIIPFQKRKEEYEKSIKELYDQTFNKYKGYDTFILGQIIKVNSKIKEKTVLLFSDTYNIYIYPDIMKLKNINNNLIKVPRELLHEQFIKIRIQDIYSYSLQGEKKEYNNIIYKDSYDDTYFTDCVTITLNDFTSLKLSVEIYDYLKKILPYKEEKDV